MNNRLINFPQITICRSVPGLYNGGGSLYYFFECAVAGCASMHSSFGEDRKSILAQFRVERLAAVYAATYVPLGIRGERYFAEKLGEFGETIESNNLKRLYRITSSDCVDDTDKKFFAIGSVPVSDIDISAVMEHPDYLNIPALYFWLVSALYDIGRAGAGWYDDLKVRIQMEREFDKTGKLCFPEDIEKCLNSSEFKAFRDSALDDKEKAYLDYYFEMTDFLPPQK